VDWIEMAQDRNQWKGLVSTVLNFRVPKFLSRCTTSGSSRRVQLRELVSKCATLHMMMHIDVESVSFSETVIVPVW
jgi:hypothetical protein